MEIIRKTDEQIRKEVRQKYIDAYNATTQEERQKFLNLIWAGKTLGQAHEEVGISFDAALEIMTQNTESIHILRKEAKK